MDRSLALVSFKITRARSNTYERECTSTEAIFPPNFFIFRIPIRISSSDHTCSMAERFLTNSFRLDRMEALHFVHFLLFFLPLSRSQVVIFFRGKIYFSRNKLNSLLKESLSGGKTSKLQLGQSSKKSIRNHTLKRYSIIRTLDVFEDKNLKTKKQNKMYFSFFNILENSEQTRRKRELQLVPLRIAFLLHVD